MPRAVYQTNYSRRVSLAVYLTWLFNRVIAWDHDFHYFDDEAAVDWVNRTFPGDIAQTFNRLQIGAAKADYWRVLILMHEGGVYLDADANFVWPPSSSIGPEDEELFLRMRDGEITNYFLACSAGNRFMTGIEAEICANIAEGTETIEETGQKIFETILATASGAPTWAERHGIHNALALFNPAPVT